MRYVKIVGSDPGCRFDLLTGRMVYRSSFLSKEEHLMDGRVTEAWAALWCFLITVHKRIRWHLQVRWFSMTGAEFILCCLGIILLCMIAAVEFGR